MFPTLLKLGPVTISSLGVMVVIGFFLASFLIWRKEKEEGFNEEKIVDGILLVTLVALLVSRTWYVLFYWAKLGASLSSWLDFVGKPGFSWVGAFLGGAVALRYVCNKNKWDFFKVADFATFGVVLGAIFVSLGQFLDGSSFGAPTDLVWGIKFPGVDQPRHPTQLYQVVFLLLIFRLLYYFDRNYRTYEWYKDKRGEAPAGFLFLAFLGLFALSKLIVGFFGERDSYWQRLQIINLFVVLLSGGWLYFRSGRLLNKFIKIGSILPNFSKEKQDGSFKSKRRLKKRSRFKTGLEAER